jgi:predicted transcriptional regulator
MITTHLQLTAQIEDVLTKVDKVIQASSSSPHLQNAKRWLQELNREVKKNPKPSKDHVKSLNKAAKILREVPMRMPELDNQLWDIEDYVESL